MNTRMTRPVRESGGFGAGKGRGDRHDWPLFWAKLLGGCAMTVLLHLLHVVPGG